MAEATITGQLSRLSGLYAIADLPPPAGITAQDYVSGLLGERPRGNGPNTLQLRAKSASHRERCDLVLQLAPLCTAAGVLLIVNDDIDAALVTPAVDGVHIGQEDLGEGSASERRARIVAIRDATSTSTVGRTLPMLIGLSTHSLEQVREAVELPVDYIGFGPIFPTTSKRCADPTVGLASLQAAAQLCKKPIVAIGGLNPARAVAALQAGASTVALISALRGSTCAQIRSKTLALSDMLLVTDHK